jgi:hypothetical protein
MSEWTQRELYILRKEFPAKPTTELARMLKRSARSISTKANKLGLKKDYKCGIVWTPQMPKILTDFFPIMFNKPLAKWLGVGLRTMLRKAYELGLKKEDGFLEKRRDDINALLSEAQKKSPDTNGTRFKKGEHRYPAGEFKKGHVLSPESEAKRIENCKKAHAKRKAAQKRLY